MLPAACRGDVTLAFGLMFTEFAKTVFPDGWYGVPPLVLGPIDATSARSMSMCRGYAASWRMPA